MAIPPRPNPRPLRHLCPFGSSLHVLPAAAISALSTPLSPESHFPVRYTHHSRSTSSPSRASCPDGCTLRSRPPKIASIVLRLRCQCDLPFLRGRPERLGRLHVPNACVRFPPSGPSQASAPCVGTRVQVLGSDYFWARVRACLWRRRRRRRRPGLWLGIGHDLRGWKRVEARRRDRMFGGGLWGSKSKSAARRIGGRSPALDGRVWWSVVVRGARRIL
ncbi:hypothetical protein BS50DRAFT_198045 [Corynespora cassiicola Philippines]|uniref:Uncharacterized protein n=1 Tax=Corynespora cassiicola Philippines TaxID=1448308 RepID=A0A2T2N5U4_CORCC|nr:hypothetical protein BS50DRAFT_198045 [Corynespora cassiicola Philippines]